MGLWHRALMVWLIARLLWHQHASPPRQIQANSCLSCVTLHMHACLPTSQLLACRWPTSRNTNWDSARMMRITWLGKCLERCL